MQFQTPTDTLIDTPQEGQYVLSERGLSETFDAARRGLLDRLRALRSTLRRQVRANSLIHFDRGHVSVGIDVGDIGLGRLEPTDVGA